MRWTTPSIAYEETLEFGDVFRCPKCNEIFADFECKWGTKDMSMETVELTFKTYVGHEELGKKVLAWNQIMKLKPGMRIVFSNDPFLYEIKQIAANTGYPEGDIYVDRLKPGIEITLQ